MQFAVIEPMPDRRTIIDALELAALERRQSITDEPADESAFVWRIAYGQFLPQPFRDSQEAAAELQTYQGAAFGRITEKFTCRLSEVRAVELFPLVMVGHSARFPCAVLIGTIDTIPPSHASAALALFPRFTSDMGPLDNTLNRPGVLALKGEEKRAVAKLNPDPSKIDWRTLIDRKRLKTQ